jgi:hypothetical protein
MHKLKLLGLGKSIQPTNSATTQYVSQPDSDGISKMLRTLFGVKAGLQQWAESAHSSRNVRPSTGWVWVRVGL